MIERSKKLGARFGLWILGLLLIVAYLRLPDPGAPLSEAEPDEARSFTDKPEIIEIRPANPVPRSTVVIRYEGADEVRGATLGKAPLQVVERSPGTLVVRLPDQAGPGYHKIRVTGAEERSKPFQIKVEPVDWRKLFRNLAGGLALVIFGLELLSRAVREATGLDNAAKLARIAVRRGASFAFGGLVGVLVQSTSSVAGLLGALVATNLLGVTAAAAAFLGAQLACGAAPFLLTSIVAPSEGLLAVALGVVWVRLASDRRSKALGRLVLGAGVMAFGLHVLRLGFEPLLSEPLLVVLLDGFRGSTLISTLNCVLLGVVLSALLQGPAPVLLLVVGLAETTGIWNFPSAVAILSGSSLGAALAALLALPKAAHVRGLGLLNLAIGALATVIGAAGVPIWCALSDPIVRGLPHQTEWGAPVLLPYLGVHLALAFVFWQVAAALLLLPIIPPLARWFERRLGGGPTVPLEKGPPVNQERLYAGIVGALRAEQKALEPIAELALSGARSLSGQAERELAYAKSHLDTLLSTTVDEPWGVHAEELQRALLGCLQLHSALETLLAKTNRLVDVRLESVREAPLSIGLPSDEQVALREMQKLLADGIDALIESLESGTPLDMDQTRAREIRMNTVEAELRGALSLERKKPSVLHVEMSVLDWVGTCEIAGNHVYRLGQTVSELSWPATSEMVSRRAS